MSQRGYIFRKGGAWYLRYRDDILQDGAVRRVQVCRKLADYDPARFRSRSKVKPLADEILAPLNNGRVGPESTRAVKQFVEGRYFPDAKKVVRPSTYKNAYNLWKKHLAHRLAEIWLRDFKTVDGEQLLADIARQTDLSHSSLLHIKALLSGAFKHARRLGILDSPNPMHDVSIPKGRQTPETCAYSLEEIQKMLLVLPEPARTVVAVAALTGLRKSEIAGLRWQDYDDIEREIHVSRAIWNGIENDPKTVRSRAPIPIVSRLADMLRTHRSGAVNSYGPIFRAGNGNPLNLDNLARREVRPSLRGTGVTWHGWHGFRRGLATNLYRLGVSDKTIQAILRHANVTTTTNIYVKSVQQDAVDAMQQLETAFCATNVQPREVVN